MSYSPNTQWSFNQEAEMSVLGGFLIDPATLHYLTELKREDFALAAHELIFTAMREAYQEKKPVDLVTVSERLHQKGVLEAVGGVGYLSGLCRSVPTTANLEGYVAIVKERAQRRRLAKAGELLMRAAQDLSKPAGEVLADGQQQLSALAEAGAPEGEMGQVMVRTLDAIDALRHGDESRRHTGIPSFDRRCGGLFGGEVTVVAARPGVGKSAFALSVAEAYAARGQRVLFLSLEMQDTQLGMRLLSTATGVSSSQMRRGKLDEEELDRLADAGTQLSRLPIRMEFNARTPEQLRAACRRQKEREGLELIVVDYIQLLEGEGGGRVNRSEEVSAITRKLKLLAKEFQVPLLELAQLNRSVEARGSNQPQLSDLRESGSIEQDADNVLFLYEPGPGEMDGRTQERARALQEIGGKLVRLAAAKQRMGVTGCFDLAFLGRSMRFVEIEAARDEHAV